MMALLSSSYYIPTVQYFLKGLSRRCVSCQKPYAKASTQRMWELPAARSQPSRPFSIIGVDFAGPFIRKEGNKRKSTQVKAYVCMYVCFSTKAVFFDPVMDQSTEAFLASLRRFTAIYGAPQEIHSDNGSNFVGANRELKNIYELLKKDETQSHLNHWSALRDISWSFTPTRAPHFGCLWESAVRLMKLTLKKVIGDQILWADEFTTLLYEAAAICNSRLLAPMETHPTDGVTPLTPGHFLTEAPLVPCLPNPTSHSDLPMEQDGDSFSACLPTSGNAGGKSFFYCCNDAAKEIHITQSAGW